MRIGLEIRNGWDRLLSSLWLRPAVLAAFASGQSDRASRAKRTPTAIYWLLLAGLLGACQGQAADHPRPSVAPGAISADSHVRWVQQQRLLQLSLGVSAFMANWSHGTTYGRALKVDQRRTTIWDYGGAALLHDHLSTYINSNGQLLTIDQSFMDGTGAGSRTGTPFAPVVTLSDDPEVCAVRRCGFGQSNHILLGHLEGLLLGVSEQPSLSNAPISVTLTLTTYRLEGADQAPNVRLSLDYCLLDGACWNAYETGIQGETWQQGWPGSAEERGDAQKALEIYDRVVKHGFGTEDIAPPMTITF
jgi:hypothetical protein